jgi:SAM-dependent methyltransferase
MTDPPGAGIDWAKASGDAWAQRWRDTDRGLEPLQKHLVTAITANAPPGPFHAFDVGCGPGSTSIAVANACPESSIVACDISEALAQVARQRTADLPRIRVIAGDAEAVAVEEGPFDVIFSRHGVMFFEDPVRAFGTLRRAAKQGGSLIFSCFQRWELNGWAAELANAAGGKTMDAPGKEPGGFALADPDRVRDILDSSGWMHGQPEAVSFEYAVSEGEHAIEDALSFMEDIGPASRVLQSLPKGSREGGVKRMRAVIERNYDGNAATFPAAAWIWTATAS